MRYSHIFQNALKKILYVWSDSKFLILEIVNTEKNNSIFTIEFECHSLLSVFKAQLIDYDSRHFPRKKI
jgi:hypothetical protein